MIRKKKKKKKERGGVMDSPVSRPGRKEKRGREELAPPCRGGGKWEKITPYKSFRPKRGREEGGKKRKKVTCANISITSPARKRKKRNPRPRHHLRWLMTPKNGRGEKKRKKKGKGKGRAQYSAVSR